MSQPIVSFVIPCYNYGRYLRDCLDRIFAQEGGYEIEVIAVNDASPDDTIEILRSYNDPRLKIIDRRENKGHVFTVNEGFAATTGKYVVRIDPDDRHRLNFLQTLVPVLEENPSIGLAYANVAIMDGSGEINVERADTVHRGQDFTGNEFIALMKKNFICAPTVIARREAWMDAWPVPVGLAFNDWYFNLMLARKWTFHYCDEVLADYRVHGSNWHCKISADGSEERSVVWLLDKIYSEPEADAELEAAKQAAKAEVYANQYLDFAVKYFGHEMNADSRRCFKEAWCWSPETVFANRLLRLWLAAYLPRPFYQTLKRLLRIS
jgi:glycosyltransferase involved in cell wall biosynthesis